MFDRHLYSYILTLFSKISVEADDLLSQSFQSSQLVVTSSTESEADNFSNYNLMSHTIKSNKRNILNDIHCDSHLKVRIVLV